MHYTSLAILSLALLPHYALAACPTSPASLKDLICMATELVNPIIGLMVGLAVLFFVWGIVKYIASAGGDAKVSAKNTMVYGVIALTVLFSFWGIVTFLQTSIFGN